MKKIEWVRPSTAAELFGVQPDTLPTWIARGIIPHDAVKTLPSGQRRYDMTFMRSLAARGEEDAAA